MNKILYDLQNYPSLCEIFSEWEKLSDRLEENPIDMPIIIPDMFWITPSGIGKTPLLNYIADFLSKKEKLVEFYGDVKFFEFYLDYCHPDYEFHEIQRFMQQVQFCAGFRNEYRGIIHIDISEWVAHSSEKHFKTFLEYLAANSDNWLIILSVSGSPREELKRLENIINSYLRLQTLTFEFPSSDKLIAICKKYLSKYNISISKSAQNLLLETIAKLRDNPYFDGFKTINMLCQDIIYYIYSSDINTKKPLQANDLCAFAADGEYTSYIINKEPQKARIKLGFVGGGSDDE